MVTGVNAYIDYFKDHPNAVGIDKHDVAFATTQPGANGPGSLRVRAAPFAWTDTQTYVTKLVHETGFGEIKLIGGYRKLNDETYLDLD